MKKKYILGLFSGLIFGCSINTFAFKIDTHVWVGQQVINDLEDDGKLTISIDGKSVNLTIPDDVKNAILSNKAAYLMGNIGPDAVPDVVIGQTVVHPGVEDSNFSSIGWRTNKWLEYLLASTGNDPLKKAFAYGYLGHAAADVFAHTYVNQYSGGIFRLTDGETLVEQRHIALESYIAKYTPPLKDFKGQAINTSWQSIVKNTAYQEFIRNSLIYNADVQQEYKKVSTASHLVAYTNFRNGIDNLSKNDIWHEIDVAVAQIVAAYYDVDITKEEAGQIVDAAQPIINTLNSDTPDTVQAASDQLYQRVSKYDAQVFGTLSHASEQMKSAEADWVSSYQSWRRKLLTVQAVPNCPKIFIGTELKCKYGICLPTDVFGPDPVCEASRKLIIESNKVILDAAEALENDAINKRNRLADMAIQVRDEGVKAAQSVYEIQNSLIDLAQVFGARVSPIQSYLESWRNDVDTAMNAYVSATSQSMLNTMDPTASALDPIKNWFECYNKSILGMPLSISGCEFKNSVADLKQSIDEILLLLEKAANVGSLVEIPGPLELKRLKDVYIASLEDQLKERIGEELKSFLPDEVKDILVLLDEGADDSLLNQYFTKPDLSAKGLLMIPDMAGRVKAEMYITPQGTFDPNKYAVAYDAVVLAKLALFDWVNIESLSIAAHSNDYASYKYRVSNLVAQAFGSIDGNHQWMLIPPPYPNSLSKYTPVNYTYSSNLDGICSGCADSEVGFMYWNGDMKDRIFRSIFKGPVSPGIDAPEVIGKSKISGMGNYPYDVCQAHPFPSDVNDKTCTAIKVLPVILSSLLH